MQNDGKWRLPPLAGDLIGCRGRLEMDVWRNREADSTGMLVDTMALSQLS